MLEEANMIRKNKAKDNEYFIYEFICKNPNITIYDLTKRIGWTSGKIHNYIKKLLKAKMIKNSTEELNGRTKRSYSPTPMKEMINWEEMTNWEETK